MKKLTSMLMVIPLLFGIQVAANAAESNKDQSSVIVPYACKYVTKKVYIVGGGPFGDEEVPEEYNYADSQGYQGTLTLMSTQSANGGQDAIATYAGTVCQN
jgi:hypothetical protein